MHALIRSPVIFILILLGSRLAEMLSNYWCLVAEKNEKKVVESVKKIILKSESDPVFQAKSTLT